MAKRMNLKSNRWLISVNVVGSTGPIRFVVKEDEAVDEVIKTALKSYARQGRVPALGSDPRNFLLYCVNGSADALSPRELIGSKQVRNFVMCKKQCISQISSKQEGRTNGWKTWLHKSFTFKNLIHSH